MGLKEFSMQVRDLAAEKSQGGLQKNFQGIGYTMEHCKTITISTRGENMMRVTLLRTIAGENWSGCKEAQSHYF